MKRSIWIMIVALLALLPTTVQASEESQPLAYSLENCREALAFINVPAEPVKKYV